MSIQPSRQTLARKEQIKISFDVRKAELRKGDLDGGNSRVLGQRVQRLETENRVLRVQIERYRERQVRWAYNAWKKKGLTEHDLDEPMPEVDRDRSVENVSRRRDV